MHKFNIVKKLKCAKNNKRAAKNSYVIFYTNVYNELKVKKYS